MNRNTSLRFAWMFAILSSLAGATVALVILFATGHMQISWLFSFAGAMLVVGLFAVIRESVRVRARGHRK